MPTVSIVIPTYKPGDALRSAIESARAQGMADAEVILVDDASPEAYQPFLDELAACYSIRLIRRERNGGPAAGHNTGVRCARGDYIAFLEHDDIFLAGKLSRQIAALEAHPEWGVCYSGWVEIDASGQTVRDPAMVYRAGSAVLPELLDRNFIWSLSAVVARKACLMEVGEMDERFSIAHDYDLWLRVAMSRWLVGCVPERLLGYRRHEASWGARNTALCIEETLQILERCRAVNSTAWRWAVRHYARCWYRLGRIRLLEGNPAAASDCFHTAVRHRPTWIKGYLGWMGAARACHKRRA